jgi:outer membrane protein assembly factor BamB
VFVSTGFESAQLWAIRPDGRGDVTASHIAWKFTQGVPLKPSILLVGEEIYMVSDNGIARCLDAKSGGQIWQARIGTAYSASPVYAGGLIYFSSEKGQTTVIKPGREMTMVAENSLNGRILASPAVAGKSLFIRTDTHLYRIER